MKRCPMCDRTYDDSQTFCVNDGATLTSDAAPSYDPMKTIVSTPPPQSQSAPLPPPSYGSGDLPGSQSPGAWQQPSTPLQQPQPQGGSAWGTNLPPASSTPFGAPQGQQNGLALGSLICGVLSLICFGPLTAIPALVLGFMQLQKIKTDPARYGGRGMAIAGMALGGLSLLFLVLWVLFIIISAIAR